MNYLVDTNVLLRFADPADPLHLAIRLSVGRLKDMGDRLTAAPQNFIELWNVATRPKTRNGLGLTPTDADQMILRLERLFPVLLEHPGVYPAWRKLVVAHGVSGVHVHDARLVALMQVHAIDHILTLNVSDFGRYASAGIVAVDPSTV